MTDWFTQNGFAPPTDPAKAPVAPDWFTTNGFKPANQPQQDWKPDFSAHAEVPTEQDVQGAMQASVPEGDQLLKNIENIPGVVKDLAVGFGKGIVRSGIRGGELLRKIPGVDTLANALPSISYKPGTFDAANPTEQAGGMVEQGAELAAPVKGLYAGGVKAADAAAPYLAPYVGKVLARAIPRAAVEAPGMAALSKAQGGSNTDAAVSGALGGALPVVGESAGAAADWLKESAGKNIGAFFNATTKPFKAKVVKQTPEILARGNEVLGGVGRSRESAVELATGKMQTAGSDVDAALAQHGADVLPQARQDLLTEIDNARTPLVQKQTVTEGQVRSNPYLAKNVVGPRGKKAWDLVDVELPRDAGKVNQLAQLKNLVAYHSNTTEDLVALRQAWDRVAYAKPSFGTSINSDEQWAKKMLGDRLRGILNSAYPDLEQANHEFSFWKDIHDVMSATVERKSGQSGGVVAPIIQSGASAAGALASGSIAKGLGTGQAMKTLYQMVRSARWQSISANYKNKLADALMSGAYGTTNSLIRQMAPRMGIVMAPEDTEGTPPAPRSVTMDEAQRLYQQHIGAQ